MKFTIDYHTNERLPKLTWLATVDQNQGLVSVIHGLSVECRDDWMVEGVWDDNFERGNFHRSEHFFGSGIRLEDDSIYFVPSSALVDRLVYCEDEGCLLVSNSLVLLLAETGAGLDENHGYYRESWSIIKGVNKYEKEFTVIHPRIKFFYQVFYENMVVSDSTVSFQKRGKSHKIDSFDLYHRMLTETLSKITENYESQERKTPISAFTTLSSGYDSTAVSCLARSLGVKICFTGKSIDGPKYLRFLQNKKLIQKKRKDNGVPVARILGFNLQQFDSRRSSVSEDELYFLSTNYPKFFSGKWSELSFHSMATYIEKNSSAAVVFTGYHGDKVWDVNTPEKYLSDEIIRGDMSGLNLTEIRLKSGFINVAVPFILARSIRDIVKISRSPEMAPWRMNNSYDRPIPRRIAESLGVERHLFGIEKGVITTRYMWPVNARFRKRFFKYLRKEHRIHSPAVYLEYLIQLLYNRPISGGILRRMGVASERGRNFLLSKDIDFYYLMCHWATRELTRRTAKNLNGARGPSGGSRGDA